MFYILGVLSIHVLISQKYQLSSCLVFFSWVYINPKYLFFCLLLFWLCFCISLGVCVCECLIIHTQPYFIYWVYLFWVHHLLFICPLLNVASIVQSFLVLYFCGCELNGGHAWGFVFVQAYAIHICVWDGLVEPGSLIELY